MKILFIGGNGNISWYCVEVALKKGHEVWVMNRSQTLITRRKIQEKVHKLTLDVHDINAVTRILNGMCFDVVIDFICYDQKDAREAVALFQGKTKKFIFISSEAVYKRAGKNLPFKENCEINDCEYVGSYIQGKIEAERVFFNAWEKNEFPVTIIRPAYTYDIIIPVSVGHNCFTAVDLYLKGYPALIAGDGTNLWSFTHSKDFARACISLAELNNVIGQDFHIATSEWLSWNEEMEILFEALEIKKFKSVHIPYDEALNLNYFQTKDLMAQRMWHNIYDVSKLKKYLPEWTAKISFSDGIKETIDWLNKHESCKRINPFHQKELERLYKMYYRK